ncbi:putative damage-inducible protein DinB [Lewinella aquimaris]|uniref:Putative damage-inducible protein DinB n=1 Tax=Neolewinella aquimaris TaxID=1835722 RepID=A0A840E1B4_9BACT|nr:DinB family protein [Neolewinella aquimaris]MBB4078910.1 putative damage-inducible protein DinB [Neolewinella aquimaris]
MKSLSVLFLLCLFLVSGTAALAQSSTDQMIQDWQRAKAFTLEYLEAMPAESYDYKPTPDMRSFAQQMLHLADGIYGISSAGTGAESPVGQGESEKSTDQSKESVIRMVTDGYDFVIASIQEMDPAILTEQINMFGRFDLSRATAIDKAFEHQTHHRGQTTVYLRLAGIEPPGEKLF